MADLERILEEISVPRPAHSQALEQVGIHLKDLLFEWGVPFFTQEFSVRHHAFFLMGVTVLMLAVLYAVFLAREKPKAALLVFLAALAVIVLEMELYIPTVSSLLQKPAENIVVSYDSPKAARELIFAAHYDSKTDIFDHIQRERIIGLFPAFVALNVLICVGSILRGRFSESGKQMIRRSSWFVGSAYVIYCGIFFSWFGGYVFLAEDQQSFGTIDDAGSVVTLLGLAKEIEEGNVALGNSKVTIVLTSGEETGLQGARAFVKQRQRDPRGFDALPASMINLEFAGQNGNLIHWQGTGGSSLGRLEMDSGLAAKINAAWQEVSGRPMGKEGTISDDSKVFLMAGVPAITIGHSGIPGMGLAGFHSPLDNLERANIENLELLVQTLKRYVELHDSQ